ncbi:MAG: hypothetical protein U5L76_03860 [Patescibacteria group bacterium]|nr:hypothetical protein [Patescibacteria group bacterium]
MKNYQDLEKEVEEKTKKRAKKRKKNMKVSGKSVFEIQKILAKKKEGT